MARVLEQGRVELFGAIQAVFPNVVTQKLNRALHQRDRADLASFSQETQLRGGSQSHISDGKVDQFLNPRSRVVEDTQQDRIPYFRGPESLRKEIDAGNWKWSLDQLQSVPEDPEACNDTEKSLLRDFETLLKSMSRIQVRSTHKNLQSRSFFAQAHLLVGRLLSDRETFFQNLEEFYDRSGQA
jgi:hypothetical protein